MIGSRLSTRGVALQRAAVDVFHDDVAAVVFGHGVVDGDDVRVRQLAGQRRLGDEQLAVALAVLVVAQHFRIDHLDRDLAVGKRVAARKTALVAPLPISRMISYLPI